MSSKSLPSSLEQYESLAKDLTIAYELGDSEAMRRLNEHYRRSFTLEDLRTEVWNHVRALREAFFQGRKGAFDMTLARTLIARVAGFGSWTALATAVAAGVPPQVQPYAIDSKQNKIAPRRNFSPADWDNVIATMSEHRISALDAKGQLTDAVMERIAELDHVTHLALAGSVQLTDGGLQHLARMPQLRYLDLSAYPGGGITDRGLEVLRHLPELRTFHMTWQRGISDAGVANLAFCDQLENVDLLGTPTGDGAIRALRGKRKLRHFKTGRLVTDAGLSLLDDFPVFKTWEGGEIRYGLASAHVEPNHLVLDGPFTDNGLASLSGLQGLFGLSFFQHTSALTADGLKPLANLPNLGFLACAGELCNDAAMRHIGAMPQLRMLMCPKTVATDDGFAALSHSSTIEYIWGRESPNLTGRGFAALSRMPSLRGLAVSCKNVDDSSLSTLPLFPALKEFMPMDVLDAGFLHVGRCEQLEALWCMYWCDVTDIATQHIASLPVLKSYHAGGTKITDRSLEILSRMPSLERVELYECNGVTDAGLVFLARLPRLREVELHGLPNVTSAGTTAFPPHVCLNYSE